MVFHSSKPLLYHLQKSIHTHVFKPIRPAIFLEQKSFAIGETARHTSFTLGRFRAVEVGYMLVSYITEPETQSDGLVIFDSEVDGRREALPMDLALILEQPQRNTVHRRIPPPLIEETTRSIQVLEIVFVGFGTPKLHVCNLEVAPKMTGAVPVRFYIVFWPSLAIHDPLSRVVLVQILGMCGHELFRLWPQGWYGGWRIVKVDGEAIGLVVVAHPTENIVVDVAEEVNLGLHAPIVADTLERRVFVEHATVPAAHLMIGYHGTVLDLLLFEHLGGLVKQIAVDPGGDCPVFFGD